MQKVQQILVTPFIYLLASLPFPLLYGLSNCIYVLLYYVIAYRRKVVMANLRNAFPNKTEAERISIAKDFYLNLCDVFLETFKTLTMSAATMQKRFTVHPDAQKIFDEYAGKGISLIFVLGHYGNWEWAGHGFSLVCKQQLYIIYHPVENKFFDDLMYKIRSKFGSKLIPMKNTFREMLTLKNEVTATAFVSDQTPSNQNAYWTTFLNQDTPVFRGTEVIAKKLDFPVCYMHIEKVKRGYYQLHTQILEQHPAQTAEGENYRKPYPPLRTGYYTAASALAVVAQALEA